MTPFPRKLQLTEQRAGTARFCTGSGVRARLRLVVYLTVQRASRFVASAQRRCSPSRPPGSDAGGALARCRRRRIPGDGRSTPPTAWRHTRLPVGDGTVEARLNPISQLHSRSTIAARTWVSPRSGQHPGQHPDLPLGSFGADAVPMLQQLPLRWIWMSYQAEIEVGSVRVTLPCT